MAWIITTTADRHQFYGFGADGSVSTLGTSWDSPGVSLFDSKEDAKSAAVRAGLKTWKYIDTNFKPGARRRQ